MALNKEQLEYIKQLAMLTDLKKKELDECSARIEKLQESLVYPRTSERPWL